MPRGSGFSVACSRRARSLSLIHSCCADCGPLGVFCSSIDSKSPTPSQFYSPPATARIAREPVLLTPSLSAACDFSTAPWVWAVLGTCIFVFLGKPLLLPVFAFQLDDADVLSSVAVRRPCHHPPVSQAKGSAPHVR